MSYIKDMRKHIGHAPMLSAGATIVVIKNNKILLNLRSDTNTWGIPGGALELGETLQETAARELKEETNLEADNFILLNVFSGKDFYFVYPNVDELYSEWNRLNREKLSVYYDSSKNPDIPLEDNNEFKVLKNRIINYILQMDMSQGENQTATDNTNKAIINDIAYMVGFFINTACSKRLDNLHSQLDEKEGEKLLRKERALGQKDGVTQDTKKEKDESEAQRAADNATVIFDLGAAAINAAYESAKAKREQQERLRREAELQQQKYEEEFYRNQYDEDDYDENEDEGFTMSM